MRFELTRKFPPACSAAFALILRLGGIIASDSFPTRLVNGLDPNGLSNSSGFVVSKLCFVEVAEMEFRPFAAAAKELPGATEVDEAVDELEDGTGKLEGGLCLPKDG